MKYKVGLVLLATGQYIRFIPPLLESVRQYFFPGHTVEVFLFTDSGMDEDRHGNPSLRVLPIQHEPWPYITLKRYEYIDANKKLFEGLDYLFYCDVDMRMVSEVSEEILPDGTRHQLAGTEHPSFACSRKPGLFYKMLRGTPWTCKFGYRRIRGTFETDAISTAYVGEEEGTVYYIGAFWGGLVAAVLEMAEKLRRNTERDLSRGHIALWHDESHLNRYFLDHPPKTLPAAYCWPERGHRPPFEAKILALHKIHKLIRGMPGRIGDSGF